MAGSSEVQNVDVNRHGSQNRQQIESCGHKNDLNRFTQCLLSGLSMISLKGEWRARSMQSPVLAKLTLKQMKTLGERVCMHVFMYTHTQSESL